MSWYVSKMAALLAKDDKEAANLRDLVCTSMYLVGTYLPSRRDTSEYGGNHVLRDSSLMDVVES
jgi:hypothetical protein